MRGLAGVALLLAAAAAAAAGDPIDDLRSADPADRERGRAALAADADGALLLRALGATEPIVREAAAEALAAAPERAGPLHRSALRGILRDRSGGRAERGAAARAPGAAGAGGAARDLRAALADLPAEAAFALGEIRDEASLPDLRRLRDGAAGAVPAEVAYALARLGDPSGGPLLLERLRDADPVASASALRLLRRWTGLDHGPAVAPWAESLRIRALASALGDRDAAAAEAAMRAEVARGPAAGPDLLSVFRDPGASVEARGKAALALGLLRYEEAGPDLLEASRPGRNTWLRVYALEALGRIAWAPAAPDIARMLVNDEDVEVARSFLDSAGVYDEVQGTAARALLDMGCDGAMGVFVDQLSRGGVGILPTAMVGEYRIRVYYHALAALRDFGGPGARGHFGYLPEAGEADRAAAGARAAAWWASRPRDLAVPSRARWSDPLFAAAVEREIAILGRFRFLEMDRSRRCLVLLGRPALPHLVAALAAADAAADPQGQVRVGIAQVLQESLFPEEAVAPLREAFRRAEIPAVRIQVMRSLARLRPPGGLPEGTALLASSSPDERAAAAEALALCPTPGTAEALRRALGAKSAAGEDPPLRIALATALLGLREKEGAGILLGYLSDGDSILRRRAWEGLDRFVDGLGPFDPRSGAGAEEVRKRWASEAAAPRGRAAGGGGR